MTLIMTKQERESFLADVHVGNAYDPGGDLRIMTGRESQKGRLLARAVRFSLCVQKESPPYKYVSVEGPIISTEPADIDRDLRPLARRYLGREMGDRYVEETRNLPTHADNVLIRMRPERWLTTDYSKG
jgi:hypothetical protein